MTATTTVLSIFCETTTPSRDFLTARSLADVSDGSLEDVSDGSLEDSLASGCSLALATPAVEYACAAVGGRSGHCFRFIAHDWIARGGGSVHRSLGGLGFCDLSLTDERVEAGDLTPHLGDLGGVLELTRGVAESQVERLLFRLAQLGDQLGEAEPRQVQRLSPSDDLLAEMTRALIGSFCTALSRAAGLARRRGTTARTARGRA